MGCMTAHAGRWGSANGVAQRRVEYNRDMRRTWIKICGLRDANIAKVAADAGADAVGRVVVDGSPRQVTVEQARQVVGVLPASVEAVAMFVDASIDHVRRTAADLGVGLVQLHGRETPEYAASLAPLRVVKAVNVDGGDAEAAVAPWRQAPANVVGLLFDAPRHGGELPGGMGRRFDWSALAALDRSELPPVIVAGGLTPENVGEAIATVRPWGVDVSTGVESSRGVKDADLVRAFTKAVRKADETLDDSHS